MNNDHGFIPPFPKRFATEPKMMAKGDSMVDNRFILNTSYNRLNSLFLFKTDHNPFTVSVCELVKPFFVGQRRKKLKHFHFSLKRRSQYSGVHSLYFNNLWAM